MITGTDAMLKVRAGKWGVQLIARARGGKRGPSRRAGLCASEWHDGAYRKIGGEPRDMTVIAVSDANQHCDATSLRCVTAKVLFSKANDDVTQMAQVFRRILRRRSQASGTGARALG